MTEPNATYREALLAELELHKAEFAALRDEILHSIDAERQSLNLCLVAIGAGLGLIPYIIGQNASVILLLFPLVFHVILWEMLHSVRTVSHVSDYLTDKLIPRVNNILDELGSNRQNTVALGWEIHVATRPIRTRELLLTALTPTRHWMPILAIATLIIAYGLTININQHAPSPNEIGLVFLNLLLLVWAAVQNTIAARTSMQHARRLKQVSTQANEKVQPHQQPMGKSSKK